MHSANGQAKRADLLIIGADSHRHAADVTVTHVYIGSSVQAAERAHADNVRVYRATTDKPYQPLIGFLYIRTILGNSWGWGIMLIGSIRLWLCNESLGCQRCSDSHMYRKMGRWEDAYLVPQRGGCAMAVPLQREYGRRFVFLIVFFIRIGSGDFGL